MPLEDFLSRVASEAGISGGASRVELLSGFPPAPLESVPDREERRGKTLASLGLSSGDALVARQGPLSDAELAAELAAADEAEAEAATARAIAAAGSSSNGGAAPSAAAQGPSSHQQHQPSAAADWSSLMGGGGGDGAAGGADLLDEDAALAAAIAASLQDSQGGGGGGGGGGGAAAGNGGAIVPSFPKPAAAPSSRRSNTDGPNFGDMRSLIASRATANDRGNPGSSNEGSVPTVSLRDGSAVARRVVDADNSCLFASVGYVMEGTRAAAPKLRALVAKAVVSDPVTYSEAFLGGEEFFFLLF